MAQGNARVQCTLLAAVSRFDDTPAGVPQAGGSAG